MAFTNNPKIVTAGNGEIAEMWTGTDGGNGAYAAGQLVYLSSGVPAACASNATLVFGLVQEAESSVSGTAAHVMVINPGDTVLIRCTNNGTDALSSTGTLLTAYGLYVASNVAYMDFNDTSNDAVVFLNHFPDANGTATYWALVHFLPTVLQAHCAV